VALGAGCLDQAGWVAEAGEGEGYVCFSYVIQSSFILLFFEGGFW
jgi:hypothetical protein